MELEEIQQSLKEKWGIKLFNFWIPLHGTPDENNCYFYTNDLQSHFGLEQLTTLIRSKYGEDIIYINEAKDFDHLNSNDIIEYKGLDTFYTNKSSEWVIYITHENTIAVTGSELMKSLKTNWAEFDKFINPWEQQFEDVIKERDNEIKLHTPIWIALSEFYLDTELNKTDLEKIAKVFTKSELTLDEIKEIDLFEVFPILQNNLSNIAGHWTGFEQKQLIEECSRFLNRKNIFLYKVMIRIRSLFSFSSRREYWEIVERKYNSLQQGV